VCQATGHAPVVTPGQRFEVEGSLREAIGLRAAPLLTISVTVGQRSDVCVIERVASDRKR